jgi:hypothetical protein
LFKEEKAREGLEKIHRVPDKYRSFRCDEEAAARQFHISDTLGEALLDLGLPHIRSGGRIMYDELDLVNIGMDLRLPTVNWSATRLWIKSLRTAQRIGHPVYDFTLKTSCQSPGHAGPCDFRFEPHIEEAFQLKEIAPGMLQFRSSPLLDTYDFGGLLSPLIDEVQTLDFHRVPSVLARDIGFLRETRLAHCQSAALYLIEVAAKQGIDAQFCTGLFISTPFTVPHVWLEIRIDDEWKQADPFFLNTLAQWEVVDPDDWSLSQSPRLAWLRLGSPSGIDTPLIRHMNDPAQLSMAVMTSLVNENDETTILRGRAS